MKVAIYARVSTQDQHADKQVAAGLDYAQRYGYEVYKTYSDVISGATESRPAWNELLEDMRKYRFRAVVVAKLDRVGRSLKHLMTLLDEFQAKKVEIITLDGKIDTTTAAGRLQWSLIGAFAEYERQLISERTKEGLARSKNRHLVGKRGKDKKPRQKRGVLRK